MMENEPLASHSDERTSKRGRLMGKLFGASKDKKLDAASAADVEAFLSRSDASTPGRTTPSSSPVPPFPSGTPPRVVPPPQLSKLDTSAASRYQKTLGVDSVTSHGLAIRSNSIEPRSSPKPNRKGLVVRFVDTYPEVIGEGGDESEIPVAEISRKKTAHAAPQASPRLVARKPVPSPSNHNLFPAPPDDRSRNETVGTFSPFRSPAPLESTSPDPTTARRDQSASTLLPGKPSSARFLGSPREKDENRKSFIEIHSAQQREAEAAAFARAARSVSASSNHDWDESKQFPTRESPWNTPPRQKTPDDPAAAPRPAGMGESPTSVYSTSSGQVLSPEKPARRRASSSSSQTGPPPPALQYQPSQRVADGNTISEAFDAFVSRTRHLFELFRLHSESVRPLMSSEPVHIARSALWWFLKGRSGLEIAIRERPSSPQSQMRHDMDTHQAYANLAKSYWLMDIVAPGIADARGLPPDPDIAEISRALISNLKKLSLSMKRNQMLPPEDAFLPANIDRSIWVEYPTISQDLVALLTGRWESGMAAAIQRQPATMDTMESLPLGDTAEMFCFGRVHVDVVIMEQDDESQQLHFPCILSMIRPLKQLNLMFVLASQNGDIRLRIQEAKHAGPVLDDIRWRNKDCSLEVRLRRGYLLSIRCSKPDYRTLWSMHDFGKRVQTTLQAQRDEMVIFRSTLAQFEYLDGDQQSRQFPKEVIPDCEVAVFEKLLKDASSGISRTFHRGFRLAVVTGARTRMLSGVHHTYLPGTAVQFGFLRGESKAPALLLKYDTGRSKGRMVLTFHNESERTRLHTLISGTALLHDEQIYTDIPVDSYTVSQTLADAEGAGALLSRIPWKSARVFNEETFGEQPPLVNSDKLRIVLDFASGTLTDRINVAPGELRIRLEVSRLRTLRIYRQPQKDLTAAVSEGKTKSELLPPVVESLKVMSAEPSIRSITFKTLAQLHEFQTALTGFAVLFDGCPSAFAISRRRMVVPIYKKWEAGATRLQVVQGNGQAGGNVMQMLVFFDGFSHARCMSIALKGTDVFETCHRNGKPGLKIVDAKFPLPGEGENAASDEGAFTCLDLPDLPGEHDDITMLFEEENDRDQLVGVLPAPVKGPSRMSRIK